MKRMNSTMSQLVIFYTTITGKDWINDQEVGEDYSVNDDSDGRYFSRNISNKDQNSYLISEKMEMRITIWVIIGVYTIVDNGMYTTMIDKQSIIDHHTLIIIIMDQQTSSLEMETTCITIISGQIMLELVEMVEEVEMGDDLEGRWYTGP